MKYTDPRDHAKLSAERRQEEAVKRNSIAERIEAIVAREKERKENDEVFFEAPYIPAYSSHKRIRVAKVG